MLEPILMSKNSERVLIYILNRQEGYAREIAKFFGADPDSIQKQLTKFESGGVFTSKLAGKTKLYRFNPRYPFVKELQALLEKAMNFYPDEFKNRLKPRKRPRRAGKPI